MQFEAAQTLRRHHWLGLLRLFQRQLFVADIYGSDSADSSTYLVREVGIETTPP